MTKDEALALIDKAKEGVIDPVVLLNWVWLRLIILKIDVDAWDEACYRAGEVASQ